MIEMAFLRLVYFDSYYSNPMHANATLQVLLSLKKLNENANMSLRETPVSFPSRICVVETPSMSKLTENKLAKHLPSETAIDGEWLRHKLYRHKDTDKRNLKKERRETASDSFRSLLYVIRYPPSVCLCRTHVRLNCLTHTIVCDPMRHTSSFRRFSQPAGLLDQRYTWPCVPAGVRSPLNWPGSSRM